MKTLILKGIGVETYETTGRVLDLEVAIAKINGILAALDNFLDLALL
tara:strand:- start:1468 stop:1608 length:141 start_codon:yes stop_codon:yes gene_type:complete